EEQARVFGGLLLVLVVVGKADEPGAPVDLVERWRVGAVAVRVAGVRLVGVHVVVVDEALAVELGAAPVEAAVARCVTRRSTAGAGHLATEPGVTVEAEEVVGVYRPVEQGVVGEPDLGVATGVHAV